jgi:hypothetical protein
LITLELRDFRLATAKNAPLYKERCTTSRYGCLDHVDVGRTVPPPSVSRSHVITLSPPCFQLLALRTGCTPAGTANPTSQHFHLYRELNTAPHPAKCANPGGQESASPVYDGKLRVGDWIRQVVGAEWRAWRASSVPLPCEASRMCDCDRRNVPKSPCNADERCGVSVDLFPLLRRSPPLSADPEPRTSARSRLAIDPTSEQRRSQRRT